MKHTVYIETSIPSFLLTWNCRHLANVNKQEHLHSINTQLGLYVPKVTTPDSLVWEEIDDGGR